MKEQEAQCERSATAYHTRMPTQQKLQPASNECLMSLEALAPINMSLEALAPIKGTETNELQTALDQVNASQP